MKYYIVMDEWLYPTCSGREFIGDYDTLKEAKEVAKKEWEDERDNFMLINGGDYYDAACGETVDENLQCTGFVHNSDPDESMNMFFKSVIIEREV